VNLYPFVQTVSKEECSLEDAIENIDIGGPTMLRSAAKNHRDVTVVVDPADYAVVLDEMRANSNAVSYKTNFPSATKVFAHTAQYDGAITNYLTSLTDELQHSSRNTLPGYVQPGVRQGAGPALRRKPASERGVLPRPQRAGRRAGELQPVAGQGTVVQQHRRFRRSVGMREDVRRAGLRDRQARESVRRGSRRGCERSYAKAFQTDPTSAFGGIIAFNREVDEVAAQAVAKQFVEVLIARRSAQRLARCSRPSRTCVCWKSLWVKAITRSI
jgi:AICAR transformylase/IMP cyclohydrolase PurH (only IMP cyclohydrolase domain in Aful)